MGRKAITLGEVLAALAIVGVFVALLLPAVQSARESSRRLQCSSNIRQVALALHHYESAYHVLPCCCANNYSFHVALLPYLEQQALFRQLDLQLNGMRYRGTMLYQRVRVFECPSDASCSRVPEYPAVTNYHGNWGTGALVYGNNGIFSYNDWQPGFTLFLPLNAITDGLSQTAIVAEVLTSEKPVRGPRAFWDVPRAHQENYSDFVKACEQAPQHIPARKTLDVARGRPWVEAGKNWTLYNHILTPNRPSCANGGEFASGAFTATSFHDGSVNVAMADGSVTPISHSIERLVWRTMGSRSGDP